MARLALFLPVLLVAGVFSGRLFAQDPPPGGSPGLEERSGPTAPERSGRAYLGVGVSRSDHDLEILEVVVGSPADRAGLKAGDVLLAIDGDELEDAADFVRRVETKKPGDSLKVEIRRGEERKTIEVTLGTRRSVIPRVEPWEDAETGAFLGVGHGEVPTVLAVHLRLDPGVGVLVGDVHPGSAAEKAGIVTHDVIVRIDSEVVKGRRGLVELIRRRRPGDEVSLEIIHRGETATKKVALGERPRVLPRFLPGDLRSWSPDSWRGRLKIGDEFDYEIPWGRLDEWRDELPGDLKEWLDQGGFDESIRKHLEEAFKDFDVWSHSRAESRVRLIEGDLDVTVSTVDGRKRVTVRRGGETIAKDLPYEELDSLPAGVREDVRKLIEKQEIESIEPPDLPGLEKIEPPGRVTQGLSQSHPDALAFALVTPQCKRRAAEARLLRDHRESHRSRPTGKPSASDKRLHVPVPPNSR